MSLLFSSLGIRRDWLGTLLPRFSAVLNQVASGVVHGPKPDETSASSAVGPNSPVHRRFIDPAPPIAGDALFTGCYGRSRPQQADDLGTMLGDAGTDVVGQSAGRRSKAE